MSKNLQCFTIVEAQLKNAGLVIGVSWFRSPAGAERESLPPDLIFWADCYFRIRFTAALAQEHVDLRPVLNWANVCSLNVPRTVRGVGTQ